MQHGRKVKCFDVPAERAFVGGALPGAGPERRNIVIETRCVKQLCRSRTRTWWRAPVSRRGTRRWPSGRTGWSTCENIKSGKNETYMKINAKESCVLKRGLQTRWCTALGWWTSFWSRSFMWSEGSWTSTARRQTCRACSHFLRSCLFYQEIAYNCNNQ